MSDAVQQIKDRLNILDVVGQYVELHKAGRHFKGKSPFTSERTPSFYVSPDRGMYYCFSTNQGGDIFTFVQTVEGVEFKDALKLLAEKANVELTPEVPERRAIRDRAYAILDEAASFYQAQLAQCSEALAYLKKRGVTESTVGTWRIGYAPGPPHGGWRELRSHLLGLKYTDQEMQAAGLVKQSDPSKEPFDVFRDRIMFPMWDSAGRIVAFSGRILHPNEKAPKYVNSPETELYKKSELLFGYDKAKAGIRSLPFWLIAEGQFDVIMCHQAGYRNTVAVSGTALTLQHVQLLERLCTKVVLALDSDRAGIAAMQKAATILLARGIDVKVAGLPDGTDPADIVQEDIKKFKSLIGSATHVIEFLLQHLRATSKDDRAYKLRVREELLPFVILIPNQIDQDHFIQVIADKIDTTADAIRHEVERHKEKSALRADTTSGAVAEEPAVPNKEVPGKTKESDLLAYLIAIIDIAPVAWREKITTVLEQEYGESIIDLKAHATAAVHSKLLFTIEAEWESYNERIQADEVVDRINRLYQMRLNEAFGDCRLRLEEAERVSDSERLEKIMTELHDLETRRKKPPYTPAWLLD